MECAKKPRKPYDPGTPAGITRLSFREGTFLVQPFTRPGQKAEGEYHVDLAEGTCTCPHFLNRIAPKREEGEEIADCKHLEYARKGSRRIALKVSRTLSEAKLREQMDRSDLRPEIHDALREAMWERLNRPGSLPLASILETVRHSADLIAA
jgi:hypothetical protein